MKNILQGSSMNYQELISRDVKDLRLLAAQYGIKVHGKSGVEKIAKAIIEHITTKPSEALQHSAEKPTSSPLIINTEESVLEAIAPYARLEGFVAKFPGDDTWYFSRKGCEESGHMSVPLRVIKMKAETVSKGARKPFIVKNADGADVMMAGI